MKREIAEFNDLSKKPLLAHKTATLHLPRNQCRESQATQDKNHFIHPWLPAPLSLITKPRLNITAISQHALGKHVSAIHVTSK